MYNIEIEDIQVRACAYALVCVWGGKGAGNTERIKYQSFDKNLFSIHFFYR